MISGFLTSVIALSDHASISRNALRWLLISTIFYSGFFSSEAFDKRTNRVSTDVADKHRLLYKRDCYLVKEVEKVTNNQGDTAHIVASITVLERTAIISAAKVSPLQNARIASMPCSFAARMAGWSGQRFPALSCLTPNKGICSI